MATATVVLAVAAFLPSRCAASITVMDSGERYKSRVDHRFGKAFVRGYEYMARLQYLQDSYHLCASSDRQSANLTFVPPDQLPGKYSL